jgi:hypothetical protein
VYVSKSGDAKSNAQPLFSKKSGSGNFEKKSAKPLIEQMKQLLEN